MSKPNPMPIPTVCDVCKGSITFIETSLAQHSRREDFAERKLVGQWLCRDKKCRAMVSCHVGTKIPFGYMAKQDVRFMRVQCHKAFDLLWCQSHGKSPLTRESAYCWLARTLQIDRSVANISKLTMEQMEKVIEESKKIYREFQKLTVQHEKAHRKCSHDKRRKQSVIRSEERKTKVKIDKRNYDNFEEM